MSHRRVSLGRIAIPCITGGVEGRLGDQGRRCAPHGPGPACRERHQQRPFFSHCPPRHLPTLASLSVVQQVFVEPAPGRPAWRPDVRGLRPCAQSAPRRRLVRAFLFNKKSQRTGQSSGGRARLASPRAYLHRPVVCFALTTHLD